MFVESTVWVSDRLSHCNAVSCNWLCFLLIKVRISLKMSRANFSLGFIIAISTPFYRSFHLHCLLIRFFYPCDPLTALMLNFMLEAMGKHPLKVWSRYYDALFWTEKQLANFPRHKHAFTQHMLVAKDVIFMKIYLQLYLYWNLSPLLAYQQMGISKFFLSDSVQTSPD